MIYKKDMYVVINKYLFSFSCIIIRCVILLYLQCVHFV